MAWPVSHRHNDYTKVFTTADRKISDSQQFPHIVHLDRDSIPWSWTEWCKNNCQGTWGWWFDSNSCYVGFEIQEEAMWFLMRYQGDIFPEKS